MAPSFRDLFFFLADVLPCYFGAVGTSRECSGVTPGGVGDHIALGLELGALAAPSAQPLELPSHCSLTGPSGDTGSSSSLTTAIKGKMESDSAELSRNRTNLGNPGVWKLLFISEEDRRSPL